MDPETYRLTDADRASVRAMQRARLRDAAESFVWTNERSGGTGRYGEAYREFREDMGLYSGTNDTGDRDPQVAFKKLSNAADIDVAISFRRAFAQGRKETNASEAYTANRGEIDALADTSWREGSATKAQEAVLDRVRSAHWIDLARAFMELSRATTSDPFAKAFRSQSQRIAALAGTDWRATKGLAEADRVALCGCWQAYLDTKK